MLILFLVVFIIGSLSGGSLRVCCLPINLLPSLGVSLDLLPGGSLLKKWLTPGKLLADHSVTLARCIAGWVSP